MADQPVGLGGDVAGHDDTDAAGDGEVPPAAGVGRSDRPDDPVADEPDDGVTVQLPAQHHELVPAEAGYRVTAPSESREPAADRAEHQVAGIVTVGIVDLLEVVQIDEEHRQP